MKRIEKINTTAVAHPHLSLELRQLVSEVFSQLCRESQQWDLPEGDRTSSLQQR